MRNDWSGQTFPHPPGRRPYVGDILGGHDPLTPVQNMLRRGRDLGPIFEMKALDNKFVFVAGSELAAELCDERRFLKNLVPGVSDLRMFAGDGLFTAYTHEPSWRLAHDLLVPSFSRAAMQKYHQTMIDVADELIERWDEAAAAGHDVEVSPDLTKVTLETIGRTSFSYSFESFQKEEVDPFVTAMIHGLAHGARRGVTEALPLGRWLVRRSDRRAMEDHRYIEDLLDDIVAQRIASGDTSQHDLLGRMLHARHEDSGRGLDALNIRRQILTFLVAGHETTSGALSFALHYLARNPDVMRAAQAELDRVLGPEVGANPTFEEVPRLRYLRRVFDETLRLWPTAPAFARSPKETTTIGGAYRMRPQDWAMVFIPLLHRQPDVWPDPEVFDPDRFLPEHVRARPAHTYKPFGTGERACIGRQFALHEAILVLAKLLHRYDITDDPGYELRITERLTLMPVGFRLHLTHRTPTPRSEFP